MSELTHFNEQGRAKMVDVTDKAVTHRTAVAAGEIHMAPETLEKIKAGTMKKGDVLARLYAGDAAKFAAAEEKFHSALTFAARRPQLPALVLARVDKDGVTRF